MTLGIMSIGCAALGGILLWLGAYRTAFLCFLAATAFGIGAIAAVAAVAAVAHVTLL